ncbi:MULTISPECIES: hypothetical protein [unclassified Pseudoclavibacter]|uniref:hypothetical protein n=1 Tax=unclassified Pseudoclavibacter TaxID=2615177 RepID=UPI001BAC981D|nr:hypothetical protein [Pseudoclavibacter sp. Marseille-Q4354]MBS3177245.1 hypothetical protein [Pseudoclavibacter sp. Marseille-Q4354]
MPWIRYPFSISAVMFNPFAWMPAILITILWLCTFWLGQSIIATVVVVWIALGQITMHIRDSELSFDFHLQSGTWIAIAALVLNWVLLTAWLVRHQDGSARIRRQWRRSMPIARPEQKWAEFTREQRQGGLA